jgi:hypothetical protein
MQEPKQEARLDMEGSMRTAPVQDQETIWQRLWRDGWRIVLLLVLAGALRAWVIGHTEVASRDSIGYIRYALALQQHPLRRVLDENMQHPGYPAVLLAVSLPVRHYLGGTTAATMQLSAQLASSLAGILLVIPMFYLGRALFDRGVGFWATAVFQALPVSTRIMGDGLSDPTFLLIAATTLLLAVRALRTGKALDFGLCGLCTGLAYLTRPEGAVLGLATGLVLLGAQAVRAWRRPWRQALRCGTCLALAAVAVGGPYAMAIGCFTKKTSFQRMRGNSDYERYEGETRRTPGREPERGDGPQPDIAAAPGRPLLASVLAAWSLDYNQKTSSGRLLWGLKALVTEMAKTFLYIGWLPALLGLWWFRERLGVMPGAWVLLLVSLVQLLALVRLTVIMGYISERHTLIVVLCGCFWGAAAVRTMGQRLAGWLAARYAWRGLAADGRVWAVFLLAAWAAAGLPSSLKPLHANRAGHHAAGLWLAEHADLADDVYDPFCWAHYYAGCVFREGAAPAPSPGHVPTVYVVLEESENQHSRLPLLPFGRQVAQAGTLVYRWCPSARTKAKERAEAVAVYAVPKALYEQLKERQRDIGGMYLP